VFAGPVGLGIGKAIDAVFGPNDPIGGKPSPQTAVEQSPLSAPTQAEIDAAQADPQSDPQADPQADGQGGAAGASSNSDNGGSHGMGGSPESGGQNGAGAEYARGGAVASSLLHGSGLIRSQTPGRGDAIRTQLPRGGYVLPADVVSAHGQGNTEAGSRGIAKRLSSLPKLARGGRVDPVDVAVSGGEFAIHPHHVAALGGGDLRRGHAALDQFVASTRARAARAARTLPGPQ
jgi:hypothetical protein